MGNITKNAKQNSSGYCDVQTDCINRVLNGPKDSRNNATKKRQNDYRANNIVPMNSNNIILEEEFTNSHSENNLNFCYENNLESKFDQKRNLRKTNGTT